VRGVENLRFKLEQLSFLSSQYIARVSTSTSGSVPHVSPVYFVADDESLFIATGKETTKYKDIAQNPVASIVVDHFDADWLHGKQGYASKERAIIILGKTTILENGPNYRALHSSFMEKYPDFKAVPSKLGEPPIIKINADKIWDHSFVSTGQ